MKTLSEQIEALRAQTRTENQAVTAFHKTLQQLQRLREMGLIKKTEYTLPLKDTIGRTVFQALQQTKPL